MDERAKWSELKSRVMEAIQVQWAETRPLKGRRLATTDSRAVKGFLSVAGVDVPRDAMGKILEELEYEGRIHRAPTQDKGAWLITEPGGMLRG